MRNPEGDFWCKNGGTYTDVSRAAVNTAAASKESWMSNRKNIRAMIGSVCGRLTNEPYLRNRACGDSATDPVRFERWDMSTCNSTTICRASLPERRRVKISGETPCDIWL